MNSALADICRKNLLAFIKITMPAYEIGWVHREICARLMNFYMNVQAKKSPRLILTMPPRHGKSQIVSKHFPAWCFGVNPDICVINSTYGDSLSKRINKDVQRIMDTEIYAELFPASLLGKKKFGESNGSIRTMELFEIPNHKGSFRTTGIGGGITGMGADILIIDDPLKDRKDANSPTIRERVWDWFTSTAYTRLSQGGGVLITLTRWHEDDIVGRLLQAEKAGGDKWELINFPAIAEVDERHRKAGEALHEARYPLSELQKIKVAIGSYDWNALYQQHPTPLEGGIFKKEWIRFYDSKPPFFDRIVQSWDFTFKDSASSDNVCGTVWGQCGADFYLLDCIAEKMDFTTSIKAILRMSKKWEQSTAKYIEDKANGTAIIDVLKSHVSGIIPVNPKGSKTERAYSVSPLFEAGNVLIPKQSEENYWVNDYVQELCTFPSAPHDDRVDSTTQALNNLGGRVGGIAGWFIKS